MKIGIITAYRSTDNYGTIIQCYATQQYMRNLGHDAYIILHGKTKKKTLKASVKKFFRNLSPSNISFRLIYLKFKHRAEEKERKLLRRTARQERARFPRHFEEFFDKYVNYSPIKYADIYELRENPPEADVYCVGSDQVWNIDPLDRKEKFDLYFLNFGSNRVGRIAYAPSLGRDTLSDYYKKIATPLLKRFSAISVREEPSKELLREMGFDKVKWVCDPSFLLTAEAYRQLYRENTIRKPGDKYLLFYWLGRSANQIDFEVDTIYEFAQKKGLKVVLVTGNNNITDREKFFATIPEWLYLIDNAEYIVTNSFHGAVFSTIFEKQYGIIPLTGEDVFKNTRLDSLFKSSHIEPRWIKRGEDLGILDRPYTADLSAFRTESLRYLDDALKHDLDGQSPP